MKLMDIDADTLNIPETEYDARVTLPSAEFTRIVRDLSQLGESVRIEVSKEGVRFASDGEAANGSVLLRQSDGSHVSGATIKPKDDEGKADEEEDEAEGSSSAKKAKVKKEKNDDDVEMDEDKEKDDDEEEFQPKSDDEGEEEQEKDEDDDDEDGSSKKRKKKVCFQLFSLFLPLTRHRLLNPQNPAKRRKPRSRRESRLTMTPLE